MIVRCSTASGFRVENLDNCTSGIPVSIANTARAVPKVALKHLSKKIPSLHRTVRVLYDKYGYPLSRRIMKPLHSDIVYILMKPIEYFFVVILYLCCNEPERKIAKQYAIPE